MEWKEYLSRLTCIQCRSGLRQGNVESFRKYRQVGSELFCPSCGARYPVVDEIPIMFPDRERTFHLLNGESYRRSVTRAKQRMAEAAQRSHDELEKDADLTNRTDALSWEILFWERWKEEGDHGFLQPDREKIEEFLREDLQGGGKLRFFEEVLQREGSVSSKRVLNIGAGRDFLLERFLDEGAELIETDIVLEPLLFLKRRGASFCICCDARALPFENDFFQVAISFEVLHHVYPIEQPVAELLRVTSGNIHIVEPNTFSFVRIARLLPGPVKRKLKQYHASDYSHSPYEKSINPLVLKKIARANRAQGIEISFPRATWLSSTSMGMKGMLRSIDLLIQRPFPCFSSHFCAKIRK